MKTGLKVAVLLMSVAVFASGCCSHAVLQGSKAIQARRMGPDGAGIGIDISNWDALTERPLLQLGAALVDASLIYGGYKGLEAIEAAINDDDDDEKLGVSVSGDNNDVDVNVVTITGDDNDSNADRETSSHNVGD